VGGSGDLTTSRETHRVVLINVNTWTGDPERVQQVIHDTDPDLVLLEEVSVRWMDALRGLGAVYPHSVARPREDNFGIALFSKHPLDGDVVLIGDVGMPSILARLRLGGHDLTLLGTHPVPPANRQTSTWRNDQLEQLADVAAGIKTPLLLLGDLNTTPWNHYFRRLVKRSGLKDSARGFGVQPTWPCHNPLLRIPLDHCLHSKDIAIVDRQVGPRVGSDHYPLIIDFAIREPGDTE
jgi:endonuclease/exonuclease/phosphatase (EEP) superfamily protein YafD